MTWCKDRILIKGQKFIEDFKSLNSSHTEVVHALKSCGLSAQVFINWRARADADGNCIAAEGTLRKLCAVSGLTYEDYFVKKLPARKTANEISKTSVTRKTKTVHRQKLKNGVVVTTYTSDSANKTDTKPVQVDELHAKISSFRSHLVVYRKLLGLSKTDMQQALNSDTYPDIESGNAVMSVSTYIKISNILMKTYILMTTDTPKSPIIDAFDTLASEYNDIYIQSVFFGDVGHQLLRSK